VSTITAAGVGFGVGLVLVPMYGIVGAAVTVLISYLTLAVLAFVFAQRMYPIRYEVGRIARLILAGLAAALTALWLVPALPPLAGLLARGTTCVAVYLALLWITGFFRATEIAFLREVAARLRKRSAKHER
jgi:O-antigen/teichoic acid export membrane protein